MNNYDAYVRRCDKQLQLCLPMYAHTQTRQNFMLRGASADLESVKWVQGPVPLPTSSSGPVGRVRALVIVTHPELAGGHLEYLFDGTSVHAPHADSPVDVDAKTTKGTLTVTYVRGRIRAVVRDASELRPLVS